MPSVTKNTISRLYIGQLKNKKNRQNKYIINKHFSHILLIYLRELPALSLRVNFSTSPELWRLSQGSIKYSAPLPQNSMERAKDWEKSLLALRKKVSTALNCLSYIMSMIIPNEKEFSSAFKPIVKFNKGESENKNESR